MATNKKTAVHPELVPLYDKLIAAVPGVERKGDTMPYTSLNGHMYSYIDKDGTFALRLPETACEAFMKKYKTTLHTSYGVVKKDFVSVPEPLFRKTAELKKYFIESFEYVSSLKPKPTTKPKSAKK